MSWEGFIPESKKYCGYGSKDLAGKLRFWFAVCFTAWPKFWGYTIRDWVRVRVRLRRLSP